jgi:hypothetical protein
MRPCKYRKERNMSISLTLHLFLTHPPSASQTHQARAPAPSHSPVRRSVYLPWLECTHRLLHRHIRLEHQHLFILPYADLCIFPGLSAPTVCFTDASGSCASTFSFSQRRSVYLPWLECTHRLPHRCIRLMRQHRADVASIENQES